MIPGIFSSNQGMVGDRQGDFANFILETAPTGTAMLLALTSGMQTKPAKDTAFTWFEDGHIANNVAIASGGTTTTVVVSDGTGFLPGDIAMVMETGEHIFVANAVDNTLTVVRGFAATSIVAVTNVMRLQKLSNASEEGSTMPTPLSQQGFLRNNYVQIFRNSWGLTGTAEAVSYNTGDRKARNKAQATQYHSEGMERAFMWGRKGVAVFNNNRLTTTDGIEAQITQYGGQLLSAASGGTPGQLSYTDYSNHLEKIFRNNVKGQPNERVAMGGNGFIGVINQMAMKNSSYNITTGETKFGVNVTTVQTPYGTLKHLTHPLMNENPVWTKTQYITHPGAIRRRMLRPTTPMEVEKTNGQDASRGVLTTEVGIEVGAANVMGIVSNASVAIAG